MLNRTGKVRQYRSQPSNGPELENHFILRLPEPQAKILREDIKQGQSNIKDRLSIQLDYAPDKEDMRNGVITFDTTMYKARLVDMPTILETWKTIDGKSFYKTADVCQMLMVREGEDPPEDDDPKKKKRDPAKLDKKYLWPHGYTPPLKNVRKRRFRKTMRKKNLDLPDIEKEVKRLLRTDNESVKVRWEVVKEDEKKISDGNPTEPNLDKLFGELSSSEEEIGGTINMLGDDDDSRMSVDDSQSFMQNEAANSPFSKAGPSNIMSSVDNLVTEFSSSMFHGDSDQIQVKQEPLSPRDNDIDRDKLYSRLSLLESELTKLKAQRSSDAAKAANIENQTLKQKFLEKMTKANIQITDKELEILEIKGQL